MSQQIRLRLGSQGLQKVEWQQVQWNALGSQVSIQLYASRSQAEELVAESIQWLEKFESLVSRFNPQSQVSLLNQADGARIEVDDMVLEVISASLWAAEKTNGIVDPLLGKHLQDIGYSQTRNSLGPEVDWKEAWSQPRHIAKSSPAQAWKQIETGDSWVELPKGYEYDPGAVGKGLAADMLVAKLGSKVSAVLVDMGGDIRALVDPGLPGFEIHLEDPRSGEKWTNVEVQGGAVATSSVCKRLWMQDGHPNHHLLSPADGKSVWSGLAGAVAFAPSALEAETLAKQAVLIGAPEVLEYGGVVYPADPNDMPIAVGFKQ